MSKKPHFGGRSLARSQALQLLFQAEATDRAVDDVLAADPCLEEGPLDPYASELARGVEGCLPELDAVISARADSWSLDRMPAVDRNLLRIALYEMLKNDEVAVAVAIDECVELEKAYGTDESPRFANGLLGRVARELEAGQDPVELAREELRQRKLHVPGEVEAARAADEPVAGEHADEAEGE